MAPKYTRTGIWYLADEYRRANERSLNIREAIEIVHPRWKQMDKQARAPYENMAKKYKSDVKSGRILLPDGSDGSRLNCLGIRQSETEDRNVYVARMRTMEMEYLTTQLVNAATGHEFIILDMEIYAETSEGIVFPAEVSICKWSIDEGMKEKQTLIMKPHAIPSGYGADFKEFEELSGIGAFYDSSQSYHDYGYVWNLLITYIQSSVHSVPVVFALQTKIDQIERAFHRLSADAIARFCPLIAGQPDESEGKIGIMSVQSLLTVLCQLAPLPAMVEQPRTAVVKPVQVVGNEKTLGEITMIMMSDKLAYDRDVCCVFHETVGKLRCAQSRLCHIVDCLDKEATVRYRR